MPKIAKSGADDASRTTKQTAERTAAAAVSATRHGAETMQSAAEADARVTLIAARSGVQAAQHVAEAAGEVQRETTRQLAEGTTDFSKLLVRLLNEQARHNLQAAVALGRIINWGEVAQVQGELMHASFMRMCQMNSRYLEIVQTVTKAGASTAGNLGRRAA